MAILNRIAHFQNRRDEIPNQELAHDLAARKDRKGIREIAENLWNRDKNIQSDCLKVLYEIGYLAPDLIAEYVNDFLKLLHSKNNRMVWGGMIALSTIASLKADVLFPHIDEIKRIMDKGTVITTDAGTKALAGVAVKKSSYLSAIFPYLLTRLKTCRPVDVPRHAEQILKTVNSSNRSQYIKVLERRMEDLSGSGLARVKKVIKQAAAQDS